MTTLDEILAALGPEAQPEFDWDAPEAGQFPPQVQPGTVEFIFKLHPGEVDNGDNGKIVDGIGTVKIADKAHMLVLFDCEVLKKDGTTAHINFQRVNSYKHEKMRQSSLQELLRSLGLQPQSSYVAVVAALQEASGKNAKGVGEVAWRFFCKTHELTISTAPRSRKVKSTGGKVKDTAWPKAGDGTFIPAVACPKCEGGLKQFGREEFVTFFSPSAENGSH